MDKKDEEITYVVIKEGFLNSAMSDAITFGTMFVMFWLNYNYLGDSLLLKWVIVIMLLAATLARGSKKINRFKKKEDAIKYIQEK